MNDYFKNSSRSDRDKEDYVSKTQQRQEALALNKFGQELVLLAPAKLSELPISETTRLGLLEYQKITSNLARKRHLNFIAKCLRNENQDAIRQHLNDNIEFQLEKKKNGMTFVDDLINLLIKNGDSEIETIVEKNSTADRQTLRQLLRNLNNAKTEQKKIQASNKLRSYLKSIIL